MLRVGVDVIARLGKRNALHPIDRIHIGIAGIAVQLHPFANAAPAGIVAGEGHDLGAIIFAQQCTEFGGAHLRVVDGIRYHPIPIVADPEPFGGVAPRVSAASATSVGPWPLSSARSVTNDRTTSRWSGV